jgi:hypothetical protein
VEQSNACAVATAAAEPSLRLRQRLPLGRLPGEQGRVRLDDERPRRERDEPKT